MDIENTRPDLEKIKTTVTSVIANIVGQTDLSLQDDAHFIVDLGLESIDLVEMVFEVERKFKIDIPLEELSMSEDRFRRLQEVSFLEFAQFIEGKTKSL